MDYLQHGIGLRGLAQLDPLVAYKNEAYTLFGDLMNMVWQDFARMIFRVEVTVQEDPGAAQEAQLDPGADAESSLQFVNRSRARQLLGRCRTLGRAGLRGCRRRCSHRTRRG